jgi:Protein of unknown function (DUF3303)
MKYVITWKQRHGGSAAENEASAAQTLEAYSKWTPSSDTTIHQFVFRADGQGGFAVVETDDVASLARTIYKFAPYAEYELHPVLDMGEAAGLAAEAVEWHKSSS